MSSPWTSPDPSAPYQGWTPQPGAPTPQQGYGAQPGYTPPQAPQRYGAPHGKAAPHAHPPKLCTGRWHRRTSLANQSAIQ